jgi:hypothetical protein
MIVAAPRLMEKIEHTVAFGIRFWDPVSSSHIVDGLSVKAYPTGQPDRFTWAIPSRSGVFVVRRLGPFGGFESSSALTSRRFTVEVSDAWNRFVPFVMNQTLSTPGRLLSIDESKEEPGGIDLFSSATRAVPSGMAVVRAELFDPVRDQPAAGAVLELKGPDETKILGLADQNGRAAMIFPWPEPQLLAAAAVAAQGLEWTFEVRGFYLPTKASPPDLREALRLQPEADLWEDVARETPRKTLVLQYGRELVLRTPAETPPIGAVLHITSKPPV